MKSNSKLIISKDYKNWISNLKLKFQQAQIKASVKVNNTLIEFYWELGADIVQKQKESSWGSGFLKQVSKDLMAKFPDVKGFSEPNLKHIRTWWNFYNSKKITSCYPNTIIDVKQFVSQIPWGQNIVIISKSKTLEEAIFYVKNTIRYSWSRSILSLQIKKDLFSREGKAITNFESQLPAPNSDLANQMLKDPYIFEFLTLTKDFKEKELEQGLVERITNSKIRT